MCAKLVAEEGILKGLSLDLEEGEEWTLGRDPESSQLVIEDPSVSRRHVIIRKTTDGLVVENSSTTNPATLNGELIEEPTLMHHGDLLQIGGEIFRFYEELPAPVLEGVETALQRAREKLGTPEEAPAPKPASPVEAPFNKPQETKYEKEALPSRDSILDEVDEAVSNHKLAEVHFDLLETGRFVLKVVAGPNNGAEFALQPGSSYVIGTDPTSCDIVFHDISVSRQHAKLTFTSDEKVFVEDTGSRNGVFIDDKKIEQKEPVDFNTLVTLGTSTFVVLDREGDRSTIISPLLPSIVKVLQKQEKERKEEEILVSQASDRLTGEEPKTANDMKATAPREMPFSFLGAFILVAILSGVFAVIGLALSTLLEEKPVEKKQVDYSKVLDEIIKNYPSVKYSYNEGVGRLVLVGHVLTAVDRNQLLYSLQPLDFIKSIDDNIVIDEFVWREQNQVIGKNPSWKGVSMMAPAPGKFVLTGYLETRKQAEQLIEYINQNFAYPELLENRVVVQEDVVARASLLLINRGLNLVKVSISNGDMKLTGVIPNGKKDAYNEAIQEIKQIPGVRSVANLVEEQSPALAAINISSKYQVTGSSTLPHGGLSVVINGRILSVGDNLDGMVITDISSNVILLEKEGNKYRIDYNK